MIGVYEPVVLVDERGARLASRITRPSLGMWEEDLYHVQCFAASGGTVSDASPG